MQNRTVGALDFGIRKLRKVLTFGDWKSSETSMTVVCARRTNFHPVFTYVPLKKMVPTCVPLKRSKLL
jgi:hypothetical protein